MCVQDQHRSPIEHALLASCAGRWREWTLVMFNVYIDDSGTAPSQRIAIASALIIPARRIRRLESEWKNFCSKYGISEFHASECAYRNRKSQFASWDDARVSAAFARIRQVTMKYAVQAISFAVTKADFDEEMPDRWKHFIGRNHYVWAVWHLLRLVRMWTEKAESRRKTEFVFDYLQGKPRKEIENAMSQMEMNHPGAYEGHYAFRKRREWAGLQCADLLAWSCLGAARLSFEKTPIHPLADQTVREYRRFRDGEWIWAKAVGRPELRRSIQKYLKDR